MVEIRAEGEVVGESAFEELHRRLVARIPGWKHSVSGILDAWHRRKLVDKVYRAEARTAREKPPYRSKAPDPQHSGNLLTIDRNPAEQLGLFDVGFELENPDLEEWMENIHGGSSSSKIQTSKNGWTTSMQGHVSLDADIAKYCLKHSSSRLSVPIEEFARYLHQVAGIDGFTAYAETVKAGCEVVVVLGEVLDTLWKHQDKKLMAMNDTTGKAQLSKLDPLNSPTIPVASQASGTSGKMRWLFTQLWTPKRVHRVCLSLI